MKSKQKALEKLRRSGETVSHALIPTLGPSDRFPARCKDLFDRELISRVECSSPPRQLSRGSAIQGSIVWCEFKAACVAAQRPVPGGAVWTFPSCFSARKAKGL